jgi:uncharacterized paraquat-inducible protein A
MAELSDFVEQYCEDCRDETDQRTVAGSQLATCLRCGHQSAVQPENDRVQALIERVRQEDTAVIGRLRTAAVPLY